MILTQEMKPFKLKQGSPDELNMHFITNRKKDLIKALDCQFDAWKSPGCLMFNCWWWQEVSSRTSVPSSKWGSVDINGKERNSNQPHNWEIMRTIVIEGRRGGLPAQLFPSCPARCCFLHKRREKRMLSLLTAESIYLLSLRGTQRSNKCFWLLTVQKLST